MWAVCLGVMVWCICGCVVCTVLWPALLDGDEAASLLDRLHDGLGVQGAQGPVWSVQTEATGGQVSIGGR